MLEFALRDLGCDFYATCFHKWLGGSHGTGVLYVRREMLDRLWPVEPRGLDASPPVFTPTRCGRHMPTCRRPCTSSATSCRYAWPALRGVEAALDFQQQVGRSKIEARIRELAIYARLRLQQLHGDRAADAGAPGPVGGHPDVPRAGQDGASTSPLRSRARIASTCARCAGRTMRDGALRIVAAHLQHARRRRETGPGPAAGAALTWTSRI